MVWFQIIDIGYVYPGYDWKAMGLFTSASPTELAVRGVGSRWGAVAAAAIFILILACTRGVELGDTALYAEQISAHFGRSAIETGSTLWEFGHLLWRPLGWLMLFVTAPVLSANTDLTTVMQVKFLLIGVSMGCSVLTVALWHWILFHVTESSKIALFVTLGFACSNGFLLYAHSGCAYIPGLLCLTLSLYLALKPFRGRVVVSALFFAAAVLLWFPYILAGLAVLMVLACPRGWVAPLRTCLQSHVVRQSILFLISAGITIMAGMGVGLAARRTESTAQARAWISDSNHGWSQSNNVVRMATGLPRSMLYLGRDGVLFRRYLRRDPYAAVKIVDLVKASFWKIVAFDVFILCLLYELLRRPTPVWPLLLLMAAAGPVVFFAVVLFEPGSPERYLPMLPFLVLATGWVLRDFPWSRCIPQYVIAGFLLAAMVNNTWAFSRPRISGQDSAVLGRVLKLQQHLKGTGLIALLSNQDLIEDVASRSPFGEINRPRPVPLYDIIQVATSRILTWRQEFAAKVLEGWNRGEEVWVSKRTWQDRPQPDWNWVEGDDRRISWAEIPAFFQRLQTDAEIGGQDGFMRLEPNESNRRALQLLAREYSADK